MLKKTKAKKNSPKASPEFTRNYVVYLLLISLTAILSGSGVYWITTLNLQARVAAAVRARTQTLSREITRLSTEIEKLQENSKEVPEIVADTPTDKEMDAVDEALENAEKESCLIKAVYSRNDVNYVDVDFVYYFEDDAAVEAALADTGCDLPNLTSENCAPTIAENYYIRNVFNDLSPLPLSETVVIELLNDDGSKARVTFDDFNTTFNNWDNTNVAKAPYYIYTWDGVVLKLVQN